MKEFKCGQLVPGCGWHTHADEEAEIIRRATEHLRTAHGEAHLRENLVEEIKKRVHEVPA